ncbi:hypothetical protein MJO29_000788 [Puccinia striiformis f. sp. tritici]|nr:hypothetical protein MJO29_000788 [Puccinia striiformis f. sp. tritici]
MDVNLANLPSATPASIPTGPADSALLSLNHAASSEAPQSTPNPLNTKSELSSVEAIKVMKICHAMEDLQLNTKKFMMAFLQQSDKDIIKRRRLWGAPIGWDSTLEVINAARDLICGTPNGRIYWKSYILSEAQACMQKEGCFRDAVAKGFYQSSKDVGPEYFDISAKKSRNHHANKPGSDDEDGFSDASSVSDSDAPQEGTPTFNSIPVSRSAAKKMKSLRQSAAWCRFFATAAGTGCRTPLTQRFGLLANMHNNQSKMQVNSATRTTSPRSYVLTILTSKRVYMTSLPRQSRMFHGTWGYLHRINPALLNSVDRKDLSLPRYKAAIAECASMTIRPSSLLPTNDEYIHFRAVLKSQIASVLLKYIATPQDTDTPISIIPPIVDQITPQKPDITMLKLMLASDNSAEGIGEVFEGITNQLDIDKSEFFGRLQVFEGDLGTCMNIESLRSQRKPSRHAQDAFANCFTLLGAAHVLWNFAQRILLLHFGDNTNANDLGAWRYMEGLGIPNKRPAAKNDFTLMLAHIQKVHEATIIQCLLSVMNTPPSSISTEEKIMRPSSELVQVIDDCYERFFSPDSRRKALLEKNTKKYNLIVRLRDFATVVECNNAMRAGDVGRLLNIWCRWTIMAQGITGLTNYGIHLPRMLLLLTKVLPPGLRKVLQHSLLICPSGRPGHFVAKDFYLEVQNYWLKYFFNRTGTGTDISRMMNVFSTNVPLLRQLVHDLRSDSGRGNQYQSHKTVLSSLAIESFLRMAQQYNICCNETTSKSIINKVTDIFDEGYEKLRKEFKLGSERLGRFNPSLVLNYTAADEAGNET